MADKQHRAKLQQLNRNFVRSVEVADVDINEIVVRPTAQEF